MDNLEKQRNRLKKVLKYLKEQGFSQAEIAKHSCYDETQIAHYKSGKIKNIPNQFLTELHEKYNINPQYIRLESNIMLDILGMKLINFEKFVDSWDTVIENNSDDSTQKKYLHFKMDKNFYDFLLNVDSLHLYNEDGILDFPEELENLKELFSGEPQLEEFVLLPKNVMYEIVEVAKRERKKFDEVIDIMLHENYNE